FGVSLAALALGGIRLAPAIFLGRLAASFTIGSQQPLWAEIAIAADNMLADAFGAWLLINIGQIGTALRTRRDIVWLAAAVRGAAALSAALGALIFTISWHLPPNGTAHAATSWFLGNVVSGL